MKLTSLPPIAALIFLAGLGFSAAQTANAPAPAPPAPPPNAMIAFLTPAQQEQYAKARAKALTDNPGLKEEGDALMKQGTVVMSTGSPADRQGFMDMMTSHRQKLRAAMLKEDPTLRPVFAEIDNHISEMRARQSIPSAPEPADVKAPAPPP